MAVTACILSYVLISQFVLIGGRSINEMMAGDVTTLHTGDEYGYKYFWLQMYQRDYFVFHVQACSDVHIALVQQRTDTTFNFTEIVLGGWYNSKSVIRTGLGNKGHYLDVETPSLLNCAESTTFWISWRNDALQVGRGPIAGSQPFMYLDRTGPVAHRIQYVGFSTGFGNTGVWRIYENQAYFLILETPDDFKYQYMWKTTDYKNNHFRFWVQAKHDAHINLSPTPGTVYYEMYIGGYGNTKSAIRIPSGEVASYMVNGIVNETEFREFWISWTDGKFQCGKGSEIGTNMFMSWTDPAFRGVNHLSVSAGYGSTALWIFNEDLENVFVYRTYADSTTNSDFKQFITTSRYEHMQLEVQACSDAWLILTPAPGAVDDMSLQVYLGIQNNTKSGIRDRFGGNALVEITKPGLLNCHQPIPLWMTWYNLTLRVGIGDIIGIDQLMSTDISSYGDVYTTVGVLNNHQNGGHYLIRRNAGDNLWFSTPRQLSYNQMRVSVVQDVYTVISVMACRDVHVAMGGVYGTLDTEAYEVVIGWLGDRTVIRDRVGSLSHVAVATTPDILSCSESRAVWIGWLDGYIRVGQGHRYGHGEVVKVLQPKPHPVNYLTFSTNGVEGIFEIEGDRGDYVLLGMYEGSQPRWFHLEPFFRWFSFQAIGSEIHLMLSSDFGDVTNTYHVIIGSSGSTQCSLWKRSTLLHTVTKSFVIDRDKPRDFWLSWSAGRIQLGAGRLRNIDTVILDYQDSAPLHVTAMGWQSVAGSAPAFLKIWDNTALEVSLSTMNPESSAIQFWRSVRHTSWTVFALRACSNVQIMLTAVIHSVENEYTYLIDMQGQNNMTTIQTWQYSEWNSVLRKIILSQVRANDLLSCTEERHFWLSWLGGHIAIGRGLKTGLHPIIAHIDLNPFRVTAIAFKSVNNEATWRTPMGQDDFPIRRPRQTVKTNLNGGDITGVVLGSILLVGLVLGLAYVVLRPPNAVRPYLYPAESSSTSSPQGLSTVSQAASGASTSQRQQSVVVSNIVSFSNPLDEFADVEIKE